VTRVLALDHGAARCGCALSDPSGTLATPLDAIERPDSRKGMARVVGLVREHAVRRVVVGLPLGLSGQDTDQTRAARDFAAALSDRLRGVPVDLYDERFTTAIAARQTAGGATGSEDSRAAAVLLDDWLARHREEAGAS
jgi:putative holliday junction resolvase